MNSAGMPDIPSLMTATVDLRHRGVGESDRMREVSIRRLPQFRRGRFWISDNRADPCSCSILRTEVVRVQTPISRHLRVLGWS